MSAGSMSLCVHLYMTNSVLQVVHICIYANRLVACMQNNMTLLLKCFISHVYLDD